MHIIYFIFILPKKQIDFILSICLLECAMVSLVDFDLSGLCLFAIFVVYKVPFSM